MKRWDTVTVDGSVRESGKLRLTLTSVVNTDMDLLNLTNEMTFGRAAWRRMIHEAEPIWWDLRLGLVWCGLDFGN